jgi:hypothetical protein
MPYLAHSEWVSYNSIFKNKDERGRIQTLEFSENPDSIHIDVFFHNSSDLLKFKKTCAKNRVPVHQRENQLYFDLNKNQQSLSLFYQSLIEFEHIKPNEVLDKIQLILNIKSTTSNSDKTKIPELKAAPSSMPTSRKKALNKDASGDEVAPGLDLVTGLAKMSTSDNPGCPRESSPPSSGRHPQMCNEFESTRNYRKTGRVIGSGTFGKVYEICVKDSPTTEDCGFVVKEVEKLETYQYEDLSFSTLGDATFIPKLIDSYICQEDGKSIGKLIVSKMDGDLVDFLKYHENLTKDDLVKILRSVKKLHENGIAHQDLNLGNILFKTRGGKNKFYISDFGGSHKFTKKGEKSRSVSNFMFDSEALPKDEAFLRDYNMILTDLERQFGIHLTVKSPEGTISTKGSTGVGKTVALQKALLNAVKNPNESDFKGDFNHGNLNLFVDYPGFPPFFVASFPVNDEHQLVDPRHIKFSSPETFERLEKLKELDNLVIDLTEKHRD